MQPVKIQKSMQLFDACTPFTNALQNKTINKKELMTQQRLLRELLVS